MSDIPQTLKGFRDFLPAQAAAREWLTQSMRGVYARFGFQPLETPTLEYRETIMGKYGDEADKLVYQFQDRGGRDVAMRYDQTVPTARVIAQYQQQLLLPFRRYQIQNVFRADKPQKGRYREFTQSDADIFGSTDTLADAEILAVFWAVYAEVGLTDLQILVNDRQSLLQLVQDAGIETAMYFPVLQALDKLDKEPRSAVEKELMGKGLAAELISKLFTLLESAKPSLQLQKILELAINLGVPKNNLVFVPTLARGLDYYTGLIFESKLPDGAGSLGGGGRYDNLIQQLAGTDIPAVGFGIGFDRTLEVLIERNKVPLQANGGPQVLVTIFDNTMAAIAAQFANFLRTKHVSTELYPTADASLGKQLKYAAHRQAKFAAIIGPDEATKHSVTLKHLASGQQYIQISEEEALRLVCLPTLPLPAAV